LTADSLHAFNEFNVSTQQLMRLGIFLHTVRIQLNVLKPTMALNAPRGCAGRQQKISSTVL